MRRPDTTARHPSRTLLVLVAAAVCTPLMGRLGDIFGKRRRERPVDRLARRGLWTTRFRRNATSALRRLPAGMLALRLSCDELAPWAGVTREQAAEQVAVLAPLVASMPKP